MGDYPETTRKERPETTRRDMPETTRPGRPDTTKMDYESTRPERPDTTRGPRPDTTKMDYPDTTKMDRPDTTRGPRPDTTKMDYPETTKMDRPESTYDYETTMERIRTTMEPDYTTPADTTEGAIQATEVWMMYATELEANKGKKCGVSGTYRAFKQKFSNLEACITLCKNDVRCKYISTEEQNHCIGCRVKPHVDAPEIWTTYELFGKDRRQLTETEVLRVEAASLRAELNKVRAN